LSLSVVIPVIGALIVFLVLWDAFETIVFPRRVTHRARLTRLFYRITWISWRALAHRFPDELRESLLGIYGPLSLIMLLSFWALMLVLGFGLMHWGYAAISEGANSLATNLYFSGTTFFTLGLGDVTPRSPIARLITVAESGTGLGFIAIVIGYLPALNQSFSRREVAISLLDSRAGSPPTAVEMLRRHNDQYGMESIRRLLHEWEQWSAELLESHLSYPVLAYFRSQHDNQSWLAALASILDTSAFVMVGLEGACTRQAQLTFAMARHAVVDLCLIFRLRPSVPVSDRLPPAELANVRARLVEAGLRPRTGDEADRELLELRFMYEPFLFALSRHFLFALPTWIPDPEAVDNWRVSQSVKDRDDSADVSPPTKTKRHF
jgi:hypothetical protein